MAWKPKQKQLAARAVREMCLTDDERRMILSTMRNARYDRDGHPTDKPTTTSQRLNNSDFEHFMAVLERREGGELLLGRGYTFGPGYWQRKADDDLARMRSLAVRIDDALLECKMGWRGDAHNRIALNGFIERMTQGDFNRLEDLHYQALYNVIEGLKQIAAREGIKLARRAHG